MIAEGQRGREAPELPLSRGEGTCLPRTAPNYRTPAPSSARRPQGACVTRPSCPTEGQRSLSHTINTFAREALVRLGHEKLSRWRGPQGLFCGLWCLPASQTPGLIVRAPPCTQGSCRTAMETPHLSAPFLSRNSRSDPGKSQRSGQTIVSTRRHLIPPSETPQNQVSASLRSEHPPVLN